MVYSPWSTKSLGTMYSIPLEVGEYIGPRDFALPLRAGVLREYLIPGVSCPCYTGQVGMAHDGPNTTGPGVVDDICGLYKLSWLDFDKPQNISRTTYDPTARAASPRVGWSESSADRSPGSNRSSFGWVGRASALTIAPIKFSPKTRPSGTGTCSVGCGKEGRSALPVTSTTVAPCLLNGEGRVGHHCSTGYTLQHELPQWLRFKMLNEYRPQTILY